MTAYVPPLDDIRFALRHMAGLEQVARLPGCEAATPDLVDQVLEEAARFAANELALLNAAGDREGARLENASPTCVMSFGDDAGAIGYLVGEEQGGMGAMFTWIPSFSSSETQRTSLRGPGEPSGSRRNLGIRNSEMPAVPGAASGVRASTIVNGVRGVIVVAEGDEDLGAANAVMVALAHRPGPERADI
jgi:Acyl-CoA dehydrogenase N terminal